MPHNIFVAGLQKMKSTNIEKGFNETTHWRNYRCRPEAVQEKPGLEQYRPGGENIMITMYLRGEKTTVTATALTVDKNLGQR